MTLVTFLGFTRRGGLRYGILAAVSVVVLLMSGVVGVTASQATTIGSTSCYTNGTYGGIRVNFDPCRISWTTSGPRVSGTMNSTSSAYYADFFGINQGSCGCWTLLSEGDYSALANHKYSISDSWPDSANVIAWAIYNTDFDQVYAGGRYLEKEGQYPTQEGCQTAGKTEVDEGYAIQFFCTGPLSNGKWQLWLVKDETTPPG